MFTTYILLRHSLLSQVAACAGTSESTWVDRPLYVPRFNAKPGSALPCLRMGIDGSPVLHTMSWGLVPSSTPRDTAPDFWRMFNARAETILEKPVFGRLLPRKRCVVLLDGYYEWREERVGAQKIKQPYYVHVGEGSILRCAALYDEWVRSSDKPPLFTVTLLTSSASAALSWLHDRQAVLLDEQRASASGWTAEAPLAPWRCSAVWQTVRATHAAAAQRRC